MPGGRSVMTNRRRCSAFRNARTRSRRQPPSVKSQGRRVVSCSRRNSASPAEDRGTEGAPAVDWRPLRPKMKRQVDASLRSGWTFDPEIRVPLARRPSQDDALTMIAPAGLVDIPARRSEPTSPSARGWVRWTQRARREACGGWARKIDEEAASNRLWCADPSDPLVMSRKSIPLTSPAARSRNAR